MLGTLRTFGKCVGQCAKLMIGVPDYDAYVAHMRATHPGAEPMSYEAFFRARQDARYGDGGSRTLRCC